MSAHIGSISFAYVVGMISAAFMCVSCSQQPANPTTPSVSANYMTGTVLLETDEFGNKPTDQSGSVVTVTNGTNVFRDTTSNDGSWTIYDIPAGVYTVSAAKQGYSGLVSGSNDVLTNVQYVGVDALTVQRLRLAKEISPSMISNAVALYRWTYSQDSSSRGVGKRDSTAYVSIQLDTRNEGTWIYDVAIVTNPTDGCEQAVEYTGGQATARAGKVTFELSSMLYGSLQARFGKDLHGVELYAQVRARSTKRATPTAPIEIQCTTPQVVALKF